MIIGLRRVPDVTLLTDALRRQADVDRDRWILWTPVGFAAGIACYFALRQEPSVWLGPSISLLAAVFLWFCRRNSVAVFVLGGILAAGLGFSAVKLRSDSVAAPVLQKPTRPISLSGTVLGLERFPDRPRVLLGEIRLRGRGSPHETPERLLLRLHPGTDVRIGDRITVLARLLPPPGPVAPGAFDYQRRVWFESIGATGFALGHIRKSAMPASTEAGPFHADLFIGRLRQNIADRIRTVLPGTDGALAVALIVGDRSAVPKQVTQSLRDSGLAHLLAISGLHIGLVASLFFFFLRAVFASIESFALRFDVKKLAACVALAASFIYLLISGATLPTQRAFLMGGLVLCAMLLDRKAISLRMVAIAALVVMVIAPESIVSASFQMSFAAVTALIAAYEALESRIRSHRRHSGLLRRTVFYFSMLLLTTLVAGIATGIVAGYHFGRVTHYGLIANLIAIPLTAFWIMPSAVAACLLMPVGFEGPGLEVMGAGIRVLIRLASEIAEWPGAVRVIPVLPATSFVVAVVGGLWLCLMRGGWRWVGPVTMAVALATSSLFPRPDVLVSASGKLAAIRTQDGSFAFSQLRSDRFTAERWMQQNGQLSAAAWEEASVGGSALRCDSLGCIYTRRGHKISFLHDPTALDEDCRHALVVVSANWHRRKCGRRTILISARELRREGAHAIYLGAGPPEVVTANSVRGRRPWVPGSTRYGQ